MQNWFKQKTYGVEHGLILITIVVIILLSLATIMAYEAIAG